MTTLWRSLREVDLQTHWFYARAYLLRRAAAWQEAEPDATILERVGGPGLALDIGCGTGRNSLWLARTGWNVTGVDLYPWTIKRATSRSLEAGLDARTRFMTGSALNLAQEVEGPYDLVLDVLGPASDLRRADLARYGQQLRAVTAPTGIVLVQSFLTPSELAPLEVSLRAVQTIQDPVSHWTFFRTRSQEG